MTLYGLFQLCGDLVCNSTVNSTNLCNIECNNLIDDNIDDDISCVLMLLTEIVDKGFKAPNLMELRKVIRLIMQDDCNHVKASTYFAECQ
ncbi:lysozyme C [Nematolebias whitei]|uniref:lysozyme C n=1 Tax=Nematolebias whitei TaxID=451745 RepID=UPI00189BF557|nr:lysozyme C [Nematolebias whitei]